MTDKLSKRRCCSKILPLAFAKIAKNRKLDKFSTVCCEMLHFFVMVINSQTHTT